MTVDDVRALRLQTKLTENAVKHFLIFQHIVIRIFYFFMCLFFCQKIALKRCHLVLAEQRRIFIQPDIPHHIPAFFPLCLIDRDKPLADIIVQNIVQRLSLISLAVDLYLLEGTVLI